MDHTTVLLEILAEIKEHGFSWDDRYDVIIAKASRSTAPTTGSAPEPAAWMNPNEPYSRDAFLWARDEDCSPEYSVPVYAAPASPAPSVLSEDAILAIAIDHGLGTAVVESIVKALLAASMGGEKSWG